MVRQCAWCLHLIDSAGERLSPSPLPKLYEASHGICSTCGTQWIAQAINAELLPMPGYTVDEGRHGPVPGSYSAECSEGVPPLETLELPELTQLVLQLQRSQHLRPASTPLAKRSKRIKIV